MPGYWNELIATTQVFHPAHPQVKQTVVPLAALVVVHPAPVAALDYPRWMGFLIACNGLSVYHVGDTILVPQMLDVLAGQRNGLALCRSTGATSSGSSRTSSATCGR